ncbi:hypothetical protein Aab01nite_14170 [Paractinoplanes abujensis]|nr:hypothetical protein Aab01nite_14170 [Actinoplanes abujensis]
MRALAAADPHADITFRSRFDDDPPAGALAGPIRAGQMSLAAGVRQRARVQGRAAPVGAKSRSKTH